MPRGYLFSIPSLPYEIYTKLNELRNALGLTQWQTVILGISAALVIGRELGEERLKALAVEVKGKYQVKNASPPGEGVH